MLQKLSRQFFNKDKDKWFYLYLLTFKERCVIAQKPNNNPILLRFIISVVALV